MFRSHSFAPITILPGHLVDAISGKVAPGHAVEEVRVGVVVEGDLGGAARVPHPQIEWFKWFKWLKSLTSLSPPSPGAHPGVEGQFCSYLEGFHSVKNTIITLSIILS